MKRNNRYFYPSAPAPQQPMPVTPGQRLIRALVATSVCSLASGPASALQLGEIDVQSALGQPLRASIAYALRPNEQLFAECIVAQPAFGFALRDNTVVSLEGSRIIVRGTAPLKEPIAALSLSVNCAYTANLTREYTLMIDPVPLAPRTGEEIQYANNPAVRPLAVAEASAATRQRAPRDRSQPKPPIGPASTYRVQPGDSLSGIATRIEDRPIALWPAVEQIFSANPQAFIDGDINRLKAGSILTIPSFGSDTPLKVADAASPAASAATASNANANSQAPTVYDRPVLEPSTVSDDNVSVLDRQLLDSLPNADTSATALSVTAETAEGIQGSFADAEQVAEPKADETADLVPGDVLVGDTAGNDSVEPQSAIVEQPGSDRGSVFGWLVLLGAAGLFVGTALFLFSRRARRNQPPPVQPAEPMQEAASDDPTTKNRVLSKVDFDVSELGDTTTAGSLDADLSEGTGLSDRKSLTAASESNADDDGYEDYAYAAALTIEEEAPPIIVPTGRVEEGTILEHEVLPRTGDTGVLAGVTLGTGTAAEDDNYDVSMIMDATQNDFSENDHTAKQIEAIAVDSIGDADDEDEYTLSNEVDYDILEQDYEAELSASQILNKEIMEAAEELQSRLAASSGSDDETGQMESIEATDTVDSSSSFSRASTAILDLDGALEDTGINEQLVVDESLTAEVTGHQTAVFPTEERAEEDPEQTELVPAAELETQSEEGIDGDRTSEIPVARVESRKIDDTSATTELTAEVTAQLPGAVNDETAEMSVESGEYRTPKTAS